MGFLGFGHKRTLSEEQEDDDRLTTQLSIAKKRAMIAELDARGADWKAFSDNGKKSGLDFQRIWAWLKSH